VKWCHKRGKLKQEQFSLSEEQFSGQGADIQRGFTRGNRGIAIVRIHYQATTNEDIGG
jgi:hypothetical protein